MTRHLLPLMLVGAAGCPTGTTISTINGQLTVGCDPVCDEGVFAVGGTYVLELTFDATRADVKAINASLINVDGDYFVSVEKWLEEGNELPEGVWNPTTDGRVIEVNTSAGYPVIYRPQQKGFHQARVSVNADARNTISGPIVFTVRAQAAVPDIAIYPPTVDFGVVDVGQVGIADVSIDNNSPLDAYISATFSAQNLYGSPEANPLFVPGLSSYSYQLEYTPLNTDPRQGTDTVVFSLGDTPIQRVKLRANDCANGTPAAYDQDRDGYTTCGGDCDDDDEATNPGASEGVTPDGSDNDCNDKIDDGTPAYDDDGDGYCESLVDCPQPGVEPGDCNDGDVRQSPDDANSEDACPGDDPICNDGIDNDCDGQVDGGTSDLDGDGYTEPEDCEEGNANRHPGARELANLIDDDCDGVKDEGTRLGDDDGDGWCEGVTYPETTNDPLLQGVCANPDADGVGDCDDSNVAVNVPGLGLTVTGPKVFPGASESLLRGIDNDCDGKIDEGTPWGDDDGDGYTEEGGDCDDGDPGRNPGMYDIPGNNIDEDCDASTPK